MSIFSTIRNWFVRKKPKQIIKIDPISYNGKKLNVQLNSAINFNQDELAKIKVSLELLVNVINSLEFKLEVLNSKFQLADGLTSSQIYDLFMSGKDKYETSPDSEFDIDITMYYSNNRTIGYTYSYTSRTWINRKFFSGMRYESICGNLAHEYCHNLSFGHPSKGYNRLNVPYQIGDIVSRLVKNMLDGRKFTPIAVEDNQ